MCFIGDPSLTSTLESLSLRCKVASLSLFYRYYFEHCSDELAACIPPPMAQPHSTWQASFAHNYCLELANERINLFSDDFFPSTSHLWNSLISSVFPASFNLPSFKKQVCHHLRGQMAWIIFFFITLFKYFINLFYSFNCLSFFFLRDTDSRKEHCAHCVFPFIKKEKSLRSKDSLSAYSMTQKWNTQFCKTRFLCPKFLLVLVFWKLLFICRNAFPKKICRLWCHPDDRGMCSGTTSTTHFPLINWGSWHITQTERVSVKFIECHEPVLNSVFFLCSSLYPDLSWVWKSVLLPSSFSTCHQS